MKKIVIALLGAAALVACLSSCAKFTCDLCHEEKSGKKYTKEVFGHEVVYCADCHEDLEEASEALDDIGDLFK